jgi:hypothetical protein
MATEVERGQSLGTQTICVEAMLGEMRNQSIQIADAVLRGEIEFDSDGIEGCLSAIERNGCEERLAFPLQSIRWPAECTAVLSGQLLPEEACQIDEQCQNGACSCGVCIAYAGDGASCVGAECGPGLACREGLCTAESHVGDSCTRPFREDFSGSCPPNLYCIGGTCRSPAEFRTVPAGGACDSIYSLTTSDIPPALCGPNLECHFTQGGQPGECRAPHAAGEVCEIGGAHGLCPSEMICQGPSTEMTCAPYRAEGEECFSSGWGDPCGPGLRCRLGESRCRDVLDNGEACELDDECYSGFCNEGSCAPSANQFCAR